MDSAKFSSTFYLLTNVSYQNNKYFIIDRKFGLWARWKKCAFVPTGNFCTTSQLWYTAQSIHKILTWLWHRYNPN